MHTETRNNHWSFSEKLKTWIPKGTLARQFRKQLLSTPQRLTEACRIMHYVTEPKLGGMFLSREMVYISFCRKVDDTYHISTSSTAWPGLEPKEKIIRYEIMVNLISWWIRKILNFFLPWNLTIETATVECINLGADEPKFRRAGIKLNLYACQLFEMCSKVIQLFTLCYFESMKEEFFKWYICIEIG